MLRYGIRLHQIRSGLYYNFWAFDQYSKSLFLGYCVCCCQYRFFVFLFLFFKWANNVFAKGSNGINSDSTWRRIYERDICYKLHYSKPPVHYAIFDFNTDGTVLKSKTTGRSRKITLRDDHALIRIIEPKFLAETS